MKAKQTNFYGKAWTVEWAGGEAFITGQSGMTVVVWPSAISPADVVASSIHYWDNVPPYLRRIVERRLLK